MVDLNKQLQNQNDSTSSLNLTEEQFKRVLPKKMRGSLKPELIDNINTLISDPHARECYRDNLLSYTSVMQDGKFKIEQYIDAVRYVSFKLLGSTNILAYTKAFPDRYQNFLNNGTSDRDIASYVSSYNKNKLVNLIYEQSLVPTHVLNADLYQKALNVQADLMTHAKSEKVRCDAANSLLTHLKVPETQKIELDIGIKEDSAIAELRASTLELVAEQRKIIEAGTMTAKDVAHSKLKIIDNDDENIEDGVIVENPPQE